MLIEKKLKIISIKKGALINELPNEVETFILESLSKSLYWNASGSAFQSPQDFIIWMDDEIKDISYDQYIDKETIAVEIKNILEDTNNWIEYLFTLTADGFIQ
ncbi:hypothetical protein EFE32_13080 [Lactococcus lactis subsp. lactis]|uniref:hypothetical protein n=1 Tax=Lactococcus lactis TaxID=1358 RepID=UPI00223ACCA0|nr:hypothetical protein [Lactococcus lactis]MCT0017704.1 hypothetical protein [Lactococcus lactis subsp. lactis]